MENKHAEIQEAINNELKQAVDAAREEHDSNVINTALVALNFLSVGARLIETQVNQSIVQQFNEAADDALNYIVSLHGIDVDTEEGQVKVAEIIALRDHLNKTRGEIVAKHVRAMQEDAAVEPVNDEEPGDDTGD